MFRHIGSFFDKWLITPITKVILKIMNIFKTSFKGFDRFSSKKSTLLFISLILAFFTFLVVDKDSIIMIDQYAEILYAQPVSAIYNEESLVVEGLPKTVDITLIGQRRHIFLAKQSPAKGVSVDLTGLKPGNHKVKLKYTQRLKSLDYKLDPSTVTITIYNKQTESRSLTTDILHKDNLDTKLFIDDVELDRTDVSIKGAEYKLKQVATVKALIDVDSILHPKEGTITLKDVPLVAYDNDGKIIEVEILPKTVSASVTITSPKKEVPIKIIPKGEVAFGKSISEISSSLNTVTVYGEQSAVDKIEQLEVVIDVNKLKENKEFNSTLVKPKGIRELSSNNINIKVTVDNSITKEFENISITPVNLDSKYKVQALTDNDRQVTVVVKGSSETVEKVEAKDLKPYIDLKDYGTGEHEVDVLVTGTDLKLAYQSKTKKVKVKITEK